MIFRSKCRVRIILCIAAFIYLRIFIDCYLRNPTKMQKPKIILLWTQKRSGSRLLGTLLSLGNSTFYIAEPVDAFELHKIVQSYRFNNTHFNNVATPTKSDMKPKNFVISNFLFNILMCGQDWKYLYKINIDVMGNTQSSEIEYLKYIKLMDDASTRQFELSLCRTSKTRLARIVFPPLNSIKKLLEDESIDLKLIYLVRDPRAVLNSRSKFRDDYFKSVQHPCPKMLEDWKSFQQFKKLYPSK